MPCVFNMFCRLASSICSVGSIGLYARCARHVLCACMAPSIPFYLSVQCYKGLYALCVQRIMWACVFHVFGVFHEHEFSLCSASSMGLHALCVQCVPYTFISVCSCKLCVFSVLSVLHVFVHRCVQCVQHVPCCCMLHGFIVLPVFVCSMCAVCSVVLCICMLCLYALC